LLQDEPMTPSRRKLQKGKGSLKQTTCSSTINCCQPSYCCLEEAHLRRASCSIKARLNRVVSVTSIVVRGPHPARLSADCNLNGLHYSGVASAYIIMNKLNEHLRLCSFQKNMYRGLGVPVTISSELLQKWIWTFFGKTASRKDIFPKTLEKKTFFWKSFEQKVIIPF
jgi:hypothetical protein